MTIPVSAFAYFGRPGPRAPRSLSLLHCPALDALFLTTCCSTSRLLPAITLLPRRKQQRGAAATTNRARCKCCILRHYQVLICFLLPAFLAALFASPNLSKMWLVECTEGVCAVLIV